jgi:hypothetical protein
MTWDECDRRMMCPVDDLGDIIGDLRRPLASSFRSFDGRHTL